MKKLKFSIVVPSYNQGHFIEDTILSIHQQQGVEKELIIVDGGSTDNTLQVIENHRDKIDYWVSEKDRGQSHAINKGLKRATGDVITWLNSDDVFLEGALEKANAYFNLNEGIGLLHGKSLLFGSDRKDQIVAAPQEDLTYRYLAYIPFPQPSSFFSREVVELLGGVDEHLHYGMDFDLLSRIFLNFEILRVDDLFSKYRMHEESKSNDLIGFARDWRKVFCRTLRSLPSAQYIIEFMKEHDWYDDDGVFYSAKRAVDEGFLHKSFCYFLLIQYHYYYQALELDTAHKVGKMLKVFDVTFYKANGVWKEKYKAQFLGRRGIQFLRNIKL